MKYAVQLCVERECGVLELTADILRRKAHSSRIPFYEH
jgi:hypothetical protein